MCPNLPVAPQASFVWKKSLLSGFTSLFLISLHPSFHRDGLLRQSQDYFQEMADLGERWGDPGNKAVAKAMEELSTFYTSFDR